MKNIITTIAVAILVGCVSEQDYSGSYILTLGRGSVHFELKSDGSFVGSPEGQEDDAVGTWKVEGNLLVCDGATTKDSDRIKIKFHKTTFELISIAENGKEVPLDRMIPDGADGIFLEKIESNPSSAATQTTESAYLGDYSLTLPKETITLKLGSDDSFSLAGLGRGNIVGAWKEKGALLVCEGTTEQDSDRITLKFDKETFKLISLARNGREAPLREWTHGTGEIYLRQNTGSPKANHELLDAAFEGKIEIVKQSLQAGANIDVQNVTGSESWTPLFGAVAYGHKEIAEILIAEGADVNRKCEDFMTPLHVLVDGGQKEMIELLISNGADVNARDIRGRTPLDTAEGAIAELLRKNGGKTGEALGSNRK